MNDFGFGFLVGFVTFAIAITSLSAAVDNCLVSTEPKQEQCK